MCWEPAVIATAVRPVPNATAGRLFPISPAPSPRVRSVTQPQLPGPIRAPALHRGIVEQGTGVLGAGSDRNRSATRSQRTAGRSFPISPAPSPRVAVSPNPSCPVPFAPQHFTVALSSNAHVWLAPVSMETALRLVPSATAGRLLPISPAASPRIAVSPRPSCPEPLSPQHLAVAVIQQRTRVVEANSHGYRGRSRRFRSVRLGHHYGAESENRREDGDERHPGARRRPCDLQDLGHCSPCP